MRRSAIAAIAVLTVVVCGCFLFVAGCGGGSHALALRVIDVKHAQKGSMPNWQPKRFLPKGLFFVNPRHGWLRLSTGADSISKQPLLETRDGGRSWSPATSRRLATTAAGYNVARLCRKKSIDNAGVASFWSSSNGYAVCGSEGGAGNERKWLYESSDGGKTWQERASYKKLPEYGYVEDLRFFDHNNGFMLTVRGGIYATGDGGLTWRKSFYNSGEGPIYWSWPDQHNGYLAAWDNGVYVTHDLGRTWQHIWPKTIPVSYASAKVAIAVSGPFPPYGTPGSTVIRTTHGGGGWSYYGRILSDNTVFQLVRISPKSVVAVASKSWAGYGRLTLLRSDNNGRSWRPLATPVKGSTDARSVSLSFAGAEGLLLDNADQRLFVTHDGGASWQQIDKHPNLSRFLVLDAKHYMAATPDAVDVYSSSDAGKSWQRLRPGIAGGGEVPLAIAATDARHIWIVAGDNDLFRTVNGGKSWVAYRIMNGFGISRIDFVSPKVGFASLNDPAASPTSPQLITRDGGRTWTSLPSGFVVRG